MNTPEPLNLLITRFLIVMPVPVSFRPSLPDPADVPVISMIGLLEKPGCVEPSRIVGFEIAGRLLLGAIVLAPLPIANLIVSAAVVLLASRIAWRSEPAPASLVLVTVNVESRTRRSTLSNKARLDPTDRRMGRRIFSLSAWQRLRTLPARN